MRVFLTGGSGYIGAHIASELSSLGDRVTILTRSPADHPELAALAGVELIHGDLSQSLDYAGLLEGHDACVHNGLIWDEQPTELQLVDPRASVAIFDAAAKVGILSMIYTSSCAVHRPFTARMAATDRLEPSDLYGATKAATEVYLSAYARQTPMRCNVIRPAATVGRPLFPGGSLNVDRKFAPIIQAAVSGGDIAVVKNEQRHFTPVEPLAKLYAAVLHSSVRRKTYVAVEPRSITWERIAREAAAIAGKGSKVVVEQTGLPGGPNVFDTSPMERDHGLQFQVWPAIREALEYMISRAES